MKWLITIWILAAGAGISYSIDKERRDTLQRLKELERSLHRLAYYMCQWKMPVKEALKQVIREEKSWLQEFYLRIEHKLAAQEPEDFGHLWQSESSQITGLTEKIKSLWSECFLRFPMESEALNKSLLERAEEIASYEKTLREKYKGEQRLVFTMGIFAGAFLCLILW